MMFWLIAAAVALVLFALAWWTSGRARDGPGLRTPVPRPTGGGLLARR